MPQQPLLLCEIFYVWGIDFMGPFPMVEAIATRTNDAKVVVYGPAKTLSHPKRTRPREWSTDQAISRPIRSAQCHIPRQPSTQRPPRLQLSSHVTLEVTCSTSHNKGRIAILLCNSVKDVSFRAWYI
ncbi:hypothetical protein CR513_52352, partial [Mucuna pruriens]